MWKNFNQVRSTMQRIGQVVAPPLDDEEEEEEDDDENDDDENDEVEEEEEDIDEREEGGEEEEENNDHRFQSPFRLVGMLTRALDNSERFHEKERPDHVNDHHHHNNAEDHDEEDDDQDHNHHATTTFMTAASQESSVVPSSLTISSTQTRLFPATSTATTTTTFPDDQATNRGPLTTTTTSPPPAPPQLLPPTHDDLVGQLSSSSSSPWRMRSSQLDPSVRTERSVESYPSDRTLRSTTSATSLDPPPRYPSRTSSTWPSSSSSATVAASSATSPSRTPPITGATTGVHTETGPYPISSTPSFASTSSLSPPVPLRRLVRESGSLSPAPHHKNTMSSATSSSQDKSLSQRLAGSTLPPLSKMENDDDEEDEDDDDDHHHQQQQQQQNKHDGTLPSPPLGAHPAPPAQGVELLLKAETVDAAPYPPATTSATKKFARPPGDPRHFDSQVLAGTVAKPIMTSFPPPTTQSSTPGPSQPSQAAVTNMTRTQVASSHASTRALRSSHPNDEKKASLGSTNTVVGSSSASSMLDEGIPSPDTRTTRVTGTSYSVPTPALAAMDGYSPSPPHHLPQHNQISAVQRRLEEPTTLSGDLSIEKAGPPVVARNHRDEVQPNGPESAVAVGWEEKCRQLSEQLAVALEKIHNLERSREVPVAGGMDLRDSIRQQLLLEFQAKEVRLLDAAQEDHDQEMKLLRESMEEQMSALQQEIDEERNTYQLERGLTQRQLQEARAKAEAAEKQLNQIKNKQTNESSQILQRQERSLRMIEDKLAQSLAVIDDRDQEIKALKTAIQKLQSKMTEHQEGAQEAEEEMDELHAENESLRNKMAAVEAKCSQLQSKLSEIQADSDKLSGLKMELRMLKEEYDRERSKNQSVVATAESNTVQLEVERDAAVAHLADLKRQLAAVQADLELSRVDASRLMQSNINLQLALEAFQSEREAELSLIEEQRRASEEATAAAHAAALEATYEAHEANMRHIQQVSEASVRDAKERCRKLEERLEEYRMENVQMRRSLDEAIQRLQLSQEDVIDRVLMKNILLDWLTKTAAKDRRQILEVMARVLHFTDAERDKVHIGEGGTLGIVVGTVAAPLPPPKADVEKLEGDTVREKWVNFLLSETED